MRWSKPCSATFAHPPEGAAGLLRQLLSSPHFLTAALVVAGSAGAIYTQATVLPFILIDRVGLSPTQFGMGMLMQTGGYLVGSLLVRQLMKRFGAFRLVPAGLVFVAIGAASWRSACACTQPSYLLVMGPVGFYTFGIAFVLPAMQTAALAPFPRIAGAAASMTGFMQMGAGLLGGTVAAVFFDDPVEALATIIPAMGADRRPCLDRLAAAAGPRAAAAGFAAGKRRGGSRDRGGGHAPIGRGLVGRSISQPYAAAEGRVCKGIRRTSALRNFQTFVAQLESRVSCEVPS